MENSTDYEIQEKLYESSRTAVYRAIRTQDRTPVVLKVLNSDYPTPEEVASFKREFTLTQRLQGEGVVKAYSLEQQAQHLVICLEDVGGVSLTTLLESRKFGLSEFLRFALRITAILGELHHQQIIHKDINPSNILWNPATDVVKVIDFGISTEVSHEQPSVYNPNVLEGTLAYMAPEQTGRMNREIDYRADLYALGMTLYEMLVGSLPFQSTDTLELIHAHLAKTPKPPHEVNPDIPKPVSQIIMKLLAKTAEDRYQSARGLAADLQKCAEQLEHTGQIQFVAVGQDDVSDRFQIPHKIYGREAQYQALLDAFERVSRGQRELVVISGYSGMGKSALAHELYKPVAERRGYFVSMNFDQVKHDSPYLSLIIAFQALIQQILTENETNIAQWRTTLLAALGRQGAVLTSIIPALEVLIGKQPPVPDLSPEESQTRLQAVFANFIQAFIASEHPLVMFLDDIEWADAASRKLLHLLLANADVHYFLAIVAYEEIETHDPTAVAEVLHDFQAAEIRITRLTLTPLSVDTLNALLADTLRSDRDYTAPLAQLVYEKTYGNPLAVREFLKALYREELLRFDPPSGQWQWNPEQIQGMTLSENVVRFMTARIQKLPETMQQMLQFAACIGNRFDLHTLALARGATEKDTAAELEFVIQEGLVLPSDDAYLYVRYLNAEELKQYAPQVNYDFVHSRIRDAADALTSNEQRAEFHLKIGRHMLQCKIHQDARDDTMTEIVNHLNVGTHLLKTEAERVKLAHLNLKVGKRTKALAAYPQALKYFSTGMALLKAKGWREHYQLTFDLYKERAEVEFSCGNFEQAADFIRQMFAKVRTNPERAEVLDLHVKLYELKGQPAEAIQLGRRALQLLDMPLPEGADVRTALDREVAEIKNLLHEKPMSTLLQEPELTLPEGKIAIRLLDKLVLATIQTNRELYYFVVAKIVNLSLKYGHTAESAYGYARYGTMLGGLWGYYKAGYEFGKLAVKLSEKFNNPAQKSKTLCTFAGELLPWLRHVKHTQPIANEAYQVGLYAGELQFAGVALMDKLLNWCYEGIGLRQMLTNLAKITQFAERTRNLAVLDMASGYRLILQNLCGLTADATSFDSEELTESQFLANCREHQSLTAICLYHVLKTQVYYLYGRPADAWQEAMQAKPSLPLIMNFPAYADYNFYAALSLAALLPNASTTDQEIYREQFHKFMHQLGVWVDHCPENFQHKYLLLQAENARLQRNQFVAMQFYKQAIESAKEHEFVHMKALAHELAAHFYVEHGFEEFARVHLMKAHGNYMLWGAARKMEHLAERYASFFTPAAPEKSQRNSRRVTRQSTEVFLSPTEQGISILDLHTVLKASQAFSGEIVLAELLKRMMRIVIENAGAQKGWLILKNGEQWMIAAEGTADNPEVSVLQAIPVQLEGTACDAPVAATIVQYVVRTGEPVVLNDATHEGNFTADPCVLKRQLKSVLCSPLVKQGKLIGVLYLENNLASGAFTTDRLEVLKMLSAQMAISIENATLYKELKEALAQQIELSNRQTELTKAYSRFVPAEFLNLLGKKSITDVQLGDQIERESTVMFSDIRGFTPLSENMTPQQNFNFINSYLSQMTPIIRKYHGFIDKYIGDAIMALFPTQADDAVQAAIAMLKQLVRYNQGRKRAGYDAIQIGIGLNTGDLMLGTVGDQERMDGTVISDTVNLASRVEGMTKVYGVSLLISETTYFQLHDPNTYAIRIIDQVQAKGKAEPVTVFEVFDGDAPRMIDLKQQSLMLFKQGFKLYHQAKFAGATSLFSDVLQVNLQGQMEQIAEAKELFKEILHMNPADKVAQIYVQRCENIEKYGIADEWKGVWAWIESLRKRGI